MSSKPQSVATPAATQNWEPVIVAFLCNWCSYAGADLAGSSRLHYPANVRVVRVPCSGRVDQLFVLKAIQPGADGVLVTGCHIGECHYLKGNYMTAKRLPVTRELLSFIGIAPERLRLDWVSASEGDKFARVITEFSETIRKLGPSPLKSKVYGRVKPTS